jgi:hypothetical protein
VKDIELKINGFDKRVSKFTPKKFHEIDPRSLPKCGAPERCFTRVGYRFSFKHYQGWKGLTDAKL